MKTRKNTLKIPASLLGMLLAIAAAPVAAISPSQIPLFLSIQSAKPNIMLMVDNSGSMSDNLTVTTPAISPGDAPADYTYSCSSIVSGGAATAAGATTIINMTVTSSGTVKICTKSDCSKSTTFGSNKCFDNNLYYKIKYYGAASTFGTYQGKNLNWYFNTGTFAQGSLNTVTTRTTTRIAVAKQAATDLVDSLVPDPGDQPTVRLGLATYNSGNGGKLLETIDDLDSTKGAALDNDIAGLSASGTTPLAETLADIGRYFATGETGNLTLHPGTTNTSATISSIFNNHSILNSTGVSPLPAPVQSYCQKNFVILVSDGLPNDDRAISTSLQDYTGDCGTRNLCVATADNSITLPGVTGKTPPYTLLKSTGTGCSSGGNWYNKACKNGTKAGRAYETGGSDYLDDVAQALFEMDLRPSLGASQKANTREKNNLVTYAIGFADPSLQTDSVLSDAAELGGGAFYFAADAKALATALENAITSISGKVGSAAAVATNSSQLGANSILYQAKFNSADWIGNFLAYSISASGTINTETPLWDAATLIPAPNSRTILTYNPTSHSGTTFQCANLSAGQKTSLGITDCNSSSDQGVWRLNFLRGDASHEKRNPSRADADNIRSTDSAVAIFRNRTHLDSLTRNMVGRDPWVLGDIVNSNPIYVGTDDFGYDVLPGTEGSSYASFRASYATRRSMVYVGANDGMLHGFDASASGGTAGQEIVAYVPNAVYANLSALTDPNYIYNHRYYVDGSPTVADAYYGSAWHTVLVGTTGAGGKGVFALDVTAPSTAFTGSKVLWEFSTVDAPTASDRTTDTSSLRGFQNNLGYTMTQSSIVRMKNGSWAAVLGNGYDSVNNKAVLYIVDVQDGHIIKAISTETGSASAPNGLSTPATADVDGDRIVDYIYAGDLLGNLWKFDVSSSSASSWGVAYSGSPLFVACDRTESPCADAHRQPITSAPEVGLGPSGGYMVYFGTGKYFETDDSSLASPETQTFYGIWDNNATVTSRSSLQAQTIASQSNGLRLTSTNSVNYPTKKGWYMDLLPPGASASVGERVVYYPQLTVDGRIVFTTLIPLPANEGEDQCGTGSNGTGWLMELDALTGKPISTGGPAIWDINKDGKIDSNDNGYGNVAGLESTVGIPTASKSVDESDTTRIRVWGGSSGENQSILESRDISGAPSRRLAWRQLR